MTVGHEETFSNDGYVHDFDCGDGCMNRTVKIYEIVHFEYIQFIVCPLHLSKTVYNF